MLAQEAPWRSSAPAWRAYGLAAETALSKELGGEQVVLAYSLARPANFALFFLATLFITLAVVVGGIALFVFLASVSVAALGVLMVLLAGWLVVGWFYVWFRLFAEWGEASRLGVGGASKIIVPILLIGFAAFGMLMGAIFMVLELTGMPNSVVVRTSTHLAIMKMKPPFLIPRFVRPKLYALSDMELSAGPAGMLTYPVEIVMRDGTKSRLAVFMRPVGVSLSADFAEQNRRALVGQA